MTTINVMAEAHKMAKAWGSENGHYAARLKECIKMVWAMLKEASKFDQTLKAVTGAVHTAFSIKIEEKGEDGKMMKKIQMEINTGTLTQAEGEVMDWLLTEGYYAEAGFSDVTVGDVADGIEQDVKATRGTIASLVKKGYLAVSEREGEIPPLVYARRKGYELDDEFTNKWEEDMNNLFF